MYVKQRLLQYAGCRNVAVYEMRLIVAIAARFSDYSLQGYRGLSQSCCGGAIAAIAEQKVCRNRCKVERLLQLYRIVTPLL